MRIAGLLLLLVCWALAGCSPNVKETPAERDSETFAAPTPGGSVIVGSDSEPDTLNPLLSTTAAAARVEYGVNESQIYETLLQYDTEAWSFTRPLLAEGEPEISEDHLTYRVTLRDGIKWHDGHPLSNEDILFSVKATMLPGVDAAALRGSFADLIDVNLAAPRTIEFKFSTPNFLNLFFVGGTAIIPRHVFDPAGLLDHLTYHDIIGPAGKTDSKAKQFASEFNKHSANRAPVGTGPFKFERWESGKDIVLVRNDDYWGRKPSLDRIVYRVIRDSAAAFAALKSGELDFVPRLSPVQYSEQTKDSGFESRFSTQVYATPQYTYIVWNQNRPVFKDKRVRQALTMLVDRKQIVEKLRYGLADLTESHFNPKSPDYDHDLTPYPFDPARARQLLDEAGWKDSDGDGIRDLNGVPFRFEFSAASASTLMAQLLPVLRAEFLKAGIDMRERLIDFTVLVEAVRDRRFDATGLNWVTPLVSDPYQVWHSSSIGDRGSNFGGFKNAEADQLIEQARMEFDAEKRRLIYKRWQEIVHEEQPYTFLFVPREAAAYAKRFRNVRFYPPAPGYDLQEWFVPAESRTP